MLDENSEVAKYHRAHGEGYLAGVNFALRAVLDVLKGEPRLALDSPADGMFQEIRKLVQELQERTQVSAQA